MPRSSPVDRIRIGISGWRYAGWRGKFYPRGLVQRRELAFAAERFDSIEDAIRREKSLKRYLRAWKINLIERDNPNWDDLFPGLL